MHAGSVEKEDAENDNLRPRPNVELLWEEPNFVN